MNEDFAHDTEESDQERIRVTQCHPYHPCPKEFFENGVNPRE